MTLAENSKNIKSEPIYYNMNVPVWFKKLNADKKCDVIENLAKELEDEEPLSRDQIVKELLS